MNFKHFIFSFKLKSQKGFAAGFTLMEILIYVAVLAIIVLAVSSILTWTISSSAKVKALRGVSDSARISIEAITHEIREAKSIYVPTSTSTQLSLETTHYLPSGETLTFIDFYLCGPATSTLCFKKEGQAPIALTSDGVEVNRLEFVFIATTTPSVQIKLGINFKNPQNRPEYQASTSVTTAASLRSY